MSSKKLLLNFTSLLSSIITIFLAIPTIYNFAKGNTISFYICLIVIFGIQIIFFRNKLKNIFSFFRYTFHFSKHQYIILEKKLYYEFLDRTTMYFSKKYTLKSTVNEFETVRGKYVYSDSSYICKPKTLNEKHKFIDEKIFIGKNMYKIILDRPYKKGEIIETGISIDLKDEHKESQLVLFANITNKTKLLKMILKFNKELTPINIELYIYSDAISDAPVAVNTLEYNYKSRQIVYIHKYPKYGQRFLIRWAFDE